MDEQARDLSAGDGSVASIIKAIMILRLLADADMPLTMTEIAREVNLTASSCHDLVSTLIQQGLVRPAAMGKSYELGIRLVAMARRSLVNRPGYLATQTLMNAVSDAHNVHLSILRAVGPATRVSTQVSEGNSPVRIRLSPGQETPLLAGAPGRFFTAFVALSEDQRRAALEVAGVKGRTAIRQHEARVAEDVARGWAVDADSQRGVASLALPIRTANGQIFGVLEVVMFRHRLEDGILGDIIKAAAEVVHAVAADL